MPTIKFGAEALEIRNLKIPKKTDLQESISYEVWGMPECEFDQHVRARVGIKFSRLEANDDLFILYPANKEALKDPENVKEMNDLLELALKSEKTDKNLSLMSRHSPYKVDQTLESLIGQMNRRLMFCEEIFIVSVHWKLRQLLLEHPDASPEWIAWVEKNCRLACDNAKRCVYSDADFLSNAFGCLFKGCGRWPDFTDGYASFNHSCTTPQEIIRDIKVIPYLSQHEIDSNISR